MPIFDQGYQHWSGTLTGHAWRWLAITRHGVRLGRRNRILRLYLLAAWAPALALVLMLCIWGLLERKSDLVGQLTDILRFIQPQMLANPRQYRLEMWTLSYYYFLLAELQLAMVMILVVGPDLISQDLRFNALPLYFSRPLRRIDYFIGKLGIIAFFLGMIIIVPSVIAYALGLLFSLDITIVRQTFPVLLGAIAYGLVIALSAGLLVLALSSLSRNSRYIALFWIGIWFVSMGLSGMLGKIDAQQRHQATYLRGNVARQAARADADFQAQQLTGRREQEKVYEDMRREQLRAAKNDWRPLVSYTANLTHIGEHLLGTRASWESLSQFMPPVYRQQFLLQHDDQQQPWYWSAGVLVGLFGLSAWILNFRVKSLDRLK